MGQSTDGAITAKFDGFRPAKTREFHGRVLVLCLVILGLSATLALARDLGFAFLRLPLDPREGWNAFHAANAFSGALYPRLPSLMYNNYPPVSFLIVGALGRITGDNIIAGRLIALASTAITALCVFAIAREMACSKIESALSAGLFLASPWLLSRFAAIDDPQMLGQALGCAGFALILRNPASGRPILSGTLLLTLACFVKPIFVAQPAALLIWFAICERRCVLPFVLCGLGCAVLGLVATRLAFGTTLLGHVLSARVFDITATLSHPGTWLLTGFAPLFATLYLFRNRSDRHAQLCAIYMTTAVIFGMVFSGGQGVGGNAMLDSSIAAALGTAVFINRAQGGAALPAWLGSSAGIVIAVISTTASALDLTAQMAASATTFSDDSFARPSLVQRRVMVREDVRFLDAQAGAAFCETLALCYWAGKAPQVDSFNLSQAFKRQARSEYDLVELLDAHRFTIIELDSRSHFWYSALLRCAFSRNYRVDHVDGLGTFLVPRVNTRNSSAVSVSNCPGDLNLIGTIN